jgi:hypothetical protein
VTSSDCEGGVEVFSISTPGDIHAQLLPDLQIFSSVGFSKKSFSSSVKQFFLSQTKKKKKKIHAVFIHVMPSIVREFSNVFLENDKLFLRI